MSAQHARGIYSKIVSGMCLSRDIRTRSDNFSLCKNYSVDMINAHLTGFVLNQLETIVERPLASPRRWFLPSIVGLVS